MPRCGTTSFGFTLRRLHHFRFSFFYLKWCSVKLSGGSGSTQWSKNCLTNEWARIGRARNPANDTSSAIFL
ncbi:hypothetical protein XA68_18087 [Ophiocordyceps unilateralis]|uniref:Uncharacterized protein n=1 Tax=Ophiocordyceps unilateralis TaxID=268505 RepID=A0A2A9P3T8_OPHUN|nr:hypothetical protein XA68_18087 [Ophiocordyceps unilateralis]